MHWTFILLKFILNLYLRVEFMFVFYIYTQNLFVEEEY